MRSTQILPIPASIPQFASRGTNRAHSNSPNQAIAQAIHPLTAGTTQRHDRFNFNNSSGIAADGEGGREGEGRVELSYVASPPDLVNPRLLAGGRIVAVAGAAGQRRHVHPAAAVGVQAGALDQATPPSSASTARAADGRPALPTSEASPARRPPGAEAAGRWRGGVRRRRAGREPREGGGGERWVGEAEEGVRLRVRSGWARLSSSWLALGRARVSSRVWPASARETTSRGARSSLAGGSSVQLGRWPRMFFSGRGPRSAALGPGPRRDCKWRAASPKYSP